MPSTTLQAWARKYEYITHHLISLEFKGKGKLLISASALVGNLKFKERISTLFIMEDKIFIPVERKGQGARDATAFVKWRQALRIRGSVN